MAVQQNAGGAGQRQATAAGKQTSAFQNGYNDYTRRCGERLDDGDGDSLDTLDSAAEFMMRRRENYHSHMLLDVAKKQDVI